MLQQLDPLRHYPVLHTGGSVNWRIVLVKPPLLLGYGGPLLLEVLQELAYGLDGVSGIDGDTHGDNVRIDEAPGVATP